MRMFPWRQSGILLDIHIPYLGEKTTLSDTPVWWHGPIIMRIFEESMQNVCLCSVHLKRLAPPGWKPKTSLESVLNFKILPYKKSSLSVSLATLHSFSLWYLPDTPEGVMQCLTSWQARFSCLNLKQGSQSCLHGSRSIQVIFVVIISPGW